MCLLTRYYRQPRPNSIYRAGNRHYFEYFWQSKGIYYKRANTEGEKKVLQHKVILGGISKRAMGI
jgi:hypothetical protein